MDPVDDDQQPAIWPLLVAMVIMVVFAYIAISVLVTSIEVRCGGGSVCATHIPSEAWRMSIVYLVFGIAAALLGRYVLGRRPQPS